MNQKFVIVGAPRTGSTLLVKTLNRIEGVRCHGELLQHPLVRGYEDGFEPLTASKSERDDRARYLVQARDRDPVNFIQNALSGTRAATGVKVLYREFLMQHWSKVIDSLRALPGIKFVHLTRRNSLRRYISEEISRAGGPIHSLPGGRGEKLTKVHVAIDEFLRRSAEIEAQARKVSLRVLDQDVLEICYEDLSASTADTVSRVCQFFGLNVEQTDITPALRKVGSVDLQDSVSNYHALIENDATRALALSD